MGGQKYTSPGRTDLHTLQFQLAPRVLILQLEALLVLFMQKLVRLIQLSLRTTRQQARCRLGFKQCVVARFLPVLQSYSSYSTQS